MKRLGGMISVLAFFFAAGVVSAQKDTAHIEGVVMDATQAVFPGVEVSVFRDDEGLEHVFTGDTNARGQFSVGGVAPGRYLLHFGSPGFAAAMTRVVVERREVRSLRILLEARPLPNVHVIPR